MERGGAGGVRHQRAAGAITDLCSCRMGASRTAFEIKVNNKTNRALTLRFRAQGLPPGAELDFGRFEEVSLQPEQRLRLAASVRLMPDEFDGPQPSIRAGRRAAGGTGIAVAIPAFFCAGRKGAGR